MMKTFLTLAHFQIIFNGCVKKGENINQMNCILQ